jgi:signal peptidase I
MTAALTDLRTVLAGGVLASVVLVAAVAISPFDVAFGSGDSMQPSLCNGSVLVVDETVEPDVGDIVVRDSGSDYVIHRAVAVTDEHVLTMGDAEDRVDMVDVTGTDETADLVVPGGREHRLAYPHHEDVRGVVVAVVDDGCSR